MCGQTQEAGSPGQVVLCGNDYVEAENEARADAKVNHVYWCQKMQKHTILENQNNYHNLFCLYFYRGSKKNLCHHTMT